MLNPQYLENCTKRLEELYSQAESDIIADMARKLNTYDYFSSSSEWQMKKAQEMGVAYDDILKRLSKESGKSLQEIKRMLNEAGIEALKADDAIYRAAGLNPKLPNMVPELAAVLTDGLRMTRGQFRNLTMTTAQYGAEQFIEALDRIYMQVVTGGFDQNTAVRDAVKDLAERGIESVRYRKRTDTIDVAVRRAARTCVNQTCGRLQEARADEMGCDLVEVTAHSGARPSHAEWQGKIFSRSGKHEKYPSLRAVTGYGTAGGLKGVNCRHDFFPFIEGVSTPAYTDKELKEINAKKYTYNGHKMTEYEATQKQRYIERQIRRWKRENAAMRAAGLSTDESFAKVAYWNGVQADFLRQTGLKRRIDSENIFKKISKNDIINILPNAENAVISPSKIFDYALKEKNKARAFQEALGYNQSNGEELIQNIRENLKNFEAREGKDSEYGKRYSILMGLTGANGKKANVMTGWIVDSVTGETRLTSVYVKKKRK